MGTGLNKKSNARYPPELCEKWKCTWRYKQIGWDDFIVGTSCTTGLVCFIAYNSITQQIKTNACFIGFLGIKSKWVIVRLILCITFHQTRHQHIPILSSCIFFRSLLYLGRTKFTNIAFLTMYDDIIERKHFPRYWPFVLICAGINAWVNNREAGDLRRHRAHYDVIIMGSTKFNKIFGRKIKRFIQLIVYLKLLLCQSLFGNWRPLLCFQFFVMPQRVSWH